MGFSGIPKTNEKVVEGFTPAQYLNVFKSMVSSDSGYSFDPTLQRKYGMTGNVENYPRTHPEYSPDTSEKAYNDSQDFLNQQYTNLTMIFATTAALGLIAVMITSSNTP